MSASRAGTGSRRHCQTTTCGYVAQGQGRLRLAEETWILEAGRCFVLRPGSRPHAIQDEENRLLVFASHFDWRDEGSENGTTAAQSTLAPMALKTGGLMVRERARFESMAQRAESAFARGDDLGHIQSELWVQHMLLLLMEEQLIPPPSALDKNIRDVIALLRREPGHWWTSVELADRAHLSRSQFARRFRAATGSSPNEFLIQARLERAQQLLSETDMSLSQIARALGYNDVFFFSR